MLNVQIINSKDKEGERRENIYSLMALSLENFFKVVF